MSFINKIFALVNKCNGPLDIDVEKQHKFICKLKEPTDDIDRSFNQYKCQQKVSPLIFFINNILSFSSLLILLFKKGASSNNEFCATVCVASWLNANVISESLQKNYSSFTFDKGSLGKLDKNDYLYLLMIFKKHPISFYFLNKTFYRIRIYKYIISKYSPKEILSSCEYSFTSSILTEYCNNNGIIHTNVMHGEKLFFIRDSFFHFDRFYIWDDYYAELFDSLHAKVDEYITELPSCFRIYKEKTSVEKYTYYFGNECYKELLQIKNNLDKIKNFKSISIRPHPIYSNSKHIKSIFKGYEIENTNEISIIESLERTSHAISLYSTVLFQAFCNDIVVIIDDVSNVSKFKKLKETQYIMLNKEQILLSSYLKNL